jgi:hypothetical protein
MIDKALSFISNYLNQRMRMSFGLNDDRVVVGSLINPDGSLTSNIENKILLSVINLEHETTVKSSPTLKHGSSNSYLKSPQPVHLNIYLLVSANYDSGNYLEALKMLSTVIGEFQSQPYFTSQENPDLPKNINKLTLEIFNLPLNELSHIWSGIGAKYVPSIVYKMRMITIDEGKVVQEIPGVSGLQTQSASKT